MSMLAQVKTSALVGIEAIGVDVQVRADPVPRETPIFTIVGQGDSAIKEARERARSALYALQLTLPPYVLVNLAPADVRKEGAGFDLAITIGILAASGRVPREILQQLSVHGEVALDGSVRPIRGMVARMIEARRAGAQLVIVPAANVREAKLVASAAVVGVSHVQEVVAFLQTGQVPAESATSSIGHIPSLPPSSPFCQVIGQDRAKRALVVAAAGGHNVLMVGPPGCGKSMLAKSSSSIFPPLVGVAREQVLQIHSCAGNALEPILQGHRPWRDPHHSISEAGLIGGGSQPRPGEVSLAHQGILFLDELPHFRRVALESLRAPLETGVVSISRAKQAMQFPAKFQLIAAMNPCPCGKLGVRTPEGIAACTCSRLDVARYVQRLSGPIIERIDLQVKVTQVPIEQLRQVRSTGSVVDGDHQDNLIREKVLAALDRQFNRQGKLNRELSLEELRERGMVKPTAWKFLEDTAEKRQFSMRTVVRCLRVARTIADVEGATMVESDHIAEGFSFREYERIREYSNCSP